MKNLKNNKTYRFLVKAKVNGNLTEAYDVTVNVCYEPVLKATVKDGTITLNWTEVNNAVKYRIAKKVSGSWKILAGTSGTSLRITGTRSGKKYTYAVQAYVDGKWTAVGSASKVTVALK